MNAPNHHFPNRKPTLHGTVQPAAQRSISTPVQRVAVAQLESRKGKELKSPVVKFGDPSSALLDHMKGEWTGSGGAAPTGGHLKSTMDSKWGGFYMGQKQADKDKTGVHLYASSLQADIPTLRMRAWYIRNDRNKVSGDKSSSFWPASWSQSALSTKLKESDKTTDDKWVTQKPNPIVWEAIGTTAYPVA